MVKLKLENLLPSNSQELIYKVPWKDAFLHVTGRRKVLFLKSPSTYWTFYPLTSTFCLCPVVKEIVMTN